MKTESLESYRSSQGRNEKTVRNILARQFFKITESGQFLLEDKLSRDFQINKLTLHYETNNIRTPSESTLKSILILRCTPRDPGCSTWVVNGMGNNCLRNGSLESRNKWTLIVLNAKVFEIGSLESPIWSTLIVAIHQKS